MPVDEVGSMANWQIDDDPESSKEFYRQILMIVGFARLQAAIEAATATATSKA